MKLNHFTQLDGTLEFLNKSLFVSSFITYMVEPLQGINDFLTNKMFNKSTV